jgi:hypothetical protein
VFIQLFIPGTAIIQQLLQMLWKTGLRLIPRETGTAVDGVIPVRCPDTVFRTATGIPGQHTRVELKIEVLA